MQSIIIVNKPIGLSPLDAIHIFKQHHPEYAQEVISYAGRLDPMASGLLVLLVGDENKRRHDYEGWKKKYTFTILLGATTDTYDMLGIVQSQPKPLPSLDSQKLHQLLQSYIGKHLQSYPPYSSRTVNGKPLYWWARNNRLGEITIPKKEIEISSLDILSRETISPAALQTMIETNLKKVTGNFRQTEISAAWKAFFGTNQPTGIQGNDFPTITCTITCSSGTYIRELAKEIGQTIGCGAFALSITRTQIGRYSLEDATPLIPASPETS